MAENGLRGPCQPASWCTPGAWSPRARWCGRWMEGGEILGSSIDVLRGTRRTWWWSCDLTMMEARRKGASAAVLDGGDVALVYYSDWRRVLQLREGEEEVRGKMKQLKKSCRWCSLKRRWWQHNVSMARKSKISVNLSGFGAKMSTRSLRGSSRSRSATPQGRGCGGVVE
jgi:hypothetical protein